MCVLGPLSGPAKLLEQIIITHGTSSPALSYEVLAFAPYHHMHGIFVIEMLNIVDIDSSAF